MIVALLLILISLDGLFSIMLATLKLTNFIDWSWVSVFSPVIIPFMALVTCFLVYFIIGLSLIILSEFSETRRIKKRKKRDITLYKEIEKQNSTGT